MDLTPALPTFIITLREGVEAALVVGIVLACLNRAGRSELNRWVYGGVTAGLIGSVLIGIFLALGLQQVQAALPSLESVVKPLLGTLFSAIAIIMLSWMLIWMTQQARSLKAEIQGSLQSALVDETAGWSIFSLVCIAVLREGFETVLFLFSNLQQSPIGVAGAIAGVIGATAIGLAIFKGGVKIDVRLFFQTMGVLLLLIVAGLVVSACKNLDAAFAAISQIDPVRSDLCFSTQSCILGPQVWDASQVLPDKTFPGIVLKALMGYRDQIYLGQIIAYGSFLALVGGRYFRSLSQVTGRGTQQTATNS
ncbi:FTR1 family protein [Romeria aff. gracilis LEGE 07310]|uniref:FTR1 family protein n=1 Tax=Vasconcelosia minhoensis LEGE 07310 TaxID=915328 RepID=A0A8J7DN92_9CYAN|nr:FTR1 family protein [Romeria gracilis]MBE9079926.1 FTR1 family protein [Romeria aff. gracilis LEGE 07310]